MDSKFWDKISNSYDESTNKKFCDANKKTIEISKKYCTKDMKLLDIGCGTGTFTIELAKYIESIDAVDCSNEMLEIARDKSKLKHIDNINWKCDDVVNSLKSGEKYNMITAFNILLYLPNLRDILTEIYNSLDDFGYFLSATDCIGESNYFIRAVMKSLSKFGVIPKMNSFKTKELEKYIEEAGFKIEFAQNIHNGEVNYFIVARKNIIK